MSNLKITHIDDKYIRYLKGSDKKVQDNKNRRRPYVGIVLQIGSFDYFVPMESPKGNHDNVKSGIHILKLDDGRLGLLGFNNMIPVHKSLNVYGGKSHAKSNRYRKSGRRKKHVCTKT